MAYSNYKARYGGSADRWILVTDAGPTDSRNPKAENSPLLRGCRERFLPSRERVTTITKDGTGAEIPQYKDPAK